MGDGIATVKQFAGGNVPSDKIRAAHDAIEDLSVYVGEMAGRHGRNPDRTSLMGALLDAEEGERLSHEELTGTFVVIFYAAHETTTNLIGNGIFELLRQPGEWERLCADPGLAASAVEETLRFNSPVHMMIRMPVEDVTVGGESISAGTGTMVLYASANRDSQAFPEADTLDITRTPNDHLAFGYGVHFCLGASLARLEGEIVFDTIARRFPDLQLAEASDSLAWNAHPTFHGLARLPVTLGRDRGGPIDGAPRRTGCCRHRRGYGASAGRLRRCMHRRARRSWWPTFVRRLARRRSTLYGLPAARRSSPELT